MNVIIANFNLNTKIIVWNKMFKILINTEV